MAIITSAKGAVTTLLWIARKWRPTKREAGAHTALLSDLGHAERNPDRYVVRIHTKSGRSVMGTVQEGGIGPFDATYLDSGVVLIMHELSDRERGWETIRVSEIESVVLLPRDPRSP